MAWSCTVVANSLTLNSNLGIYIPDIVPALFGVRVFLLSEAGDRTRSRPFRAGCAEPGLKARLLEGDGAFELEHPIKLAAALGGVPAG